MLEAVWAGSSPSSRQIAQAEVSMLVFGKSCSGASLFAMDSSGLGSLMAARSVVYSGSLMSTVGMLRVGGRGLFVEDFAQMDFSLSSRALAQLALLLLVCGVCRLEPLVLFSDYLNLGFTLLVRACAKLDATVLPFNFGLLGFSLPIRSLVQSGLPMLIVGVAAIRGDAAIQDTVSVQGAMQVGFTCLIFGNVCFGSLVPTLDFVTFGSVPPSRQFGHLEFALLVCGSSWMDVSTPSSDTFLADFLVLLQELAHPSFALLALAAARPGCILLVPDLAGMGPAPSAQNFVQVDLALPVPRGARFGNLLPVLDFLHCDSMLFAQSFSCIEFVVPSLGVCGAGFLLSLKNLA